MERRKKQVKVAISVEKLSIGKTENSLESVLLVKSWNDWNMTLLGLS